MFVGARASFRPSAISVLALLLAPTLLAAVLVVAPEARAHGGVEPRDWETRILADANDDYLLSDGDIDVLTLDLGELYIGGFRDHLLLLRVGTRYTWNESTAQELGLNLSFTLNQRPLSAQATTRDGENWSHDGLFEAAVFTDARGDQAVYFVQTFRRLDLHVGDEFADFSVTGFRTVNETTLDGDRMPGFTLVPGNERLADRPLGWPKELPDLDRPANESLERWDSGNVTSLDPSSGASYTIGSYAVRGALSFFDVTVNRTEAEVPRRGFASFNVTVRNRLDFPYAVGFVLGDVTQHDWRVRYETRVVQVLPADGKVDFTFRLSPLVNGVPASRLRAPFTIISNVGGVGAGEVFVRLVGVPRTDPTETHIEFLDLGAPPPANTVTLLTFRITNETGAPLTGLTGVRLTVQRSGFGASAVHRLPEKDPNYGTVPGLYETPYVFLYPGSYRLRVAVHDFDDRPSSEFLIDAGKIPKAEGLDLPGFELPVLVLAAVLVALFVRRKAR